MARHQDRTSSLEERLTIVGVQDDGSVDVLSGLLVEVGDLDLLGIDRRLRDQQMLGGHLEEDFGRSLEVETVLAVGKLDDDTPARSEGETMGRHGLEERWRSHTTHIDFLSDEKGLKEAKEGKSARETLECKGRGTEDSQHLHDVRSLSRGLVIRPSELLTEPEQGRFCLGSDELKLSGLGIFVLKSGRIEDERVIEELPGLLVEDRVDVRHVERKVLAALSSGLGFSLLSDGLDEKKDRVSERVTAKTRRRKGRTLLALVRFRFSSSRWTNLAWTPMEPATTDMTF